jgi:NADPH:quinone reductase-like Zn-dependent oxidoreductase
MLGYQIVKFGDIDGIARAELPEPPPLGRTDVRVRIRACSLNYRDLRVLTNAYGGASKPGLVPLSDAAGEVVEAGPGAWHVAVGDRVALTFNPDWDGGDWSLTPGVAGRGGVIQGVLREEVMVDHREAVPLAPHLSYEQGATLPCAALTAWSALCAGRPLLPGETVLLQGTGGVSIFGLQLAKLFGASVLITSSSDDKLTRAKELGADIGINYHTHPEWDKEVLRLTGGRGTDKVIDLGGQDTIAQSLSAVRHNGVISIVGVLSGPPSGSGAMLNAKWADLHMIRVGSRQDFERMMRAIDYHHLEPVIDRVYGFGDVLDALRRLKSGAHFGKIVIRMP